MAKYFDVDVKVHIVARMVEAEDKDDAVMKLFPCGYKGEMWDWDGNITLVKEE